jgi:hypothetical protein
MDVRIGFYYIYSLNLEATRRIIMLSPFQFPYVQRSSICGPQLSTWIL